VPIKGAKNAKTIKLAFIKVFQTIGPEMSLKMMYDRELEME
jgi:hypothetical protein